MRYHLILLKLGVECWWGRYTLTIVKGAPQALPGSSSAVGTQGAQHAHQRQPSASSVASVALSEAELGIDAVVKRHVESAELLSRAAGEIAFRLPKGDAPK